MNFLIDYILVVHNQLHYTRQCVESIHRTSPRPFRLIIVDNASTDGTKAYLEELVRSGSSGAEVLVLYLAENEGYTKAANRGFRLVRAPYAVMMNNDVVIYPGAVEEMLRVAEGDPRIGMINPNSNEFGVNSRDAGKLASLKGKWIERFHVSGFFSIVRREVLEKAGLLDPLFSPGYFEDMDLSERARQAGFLCVMASGAYVHHYGTRTFRSREKRALWKMHQKIFSALWGSTERAVCIAAGNQDRGEILRALTDLVRSRHIYVYLFVPTEEAEYYRERHAGIRVRGTPRKALFPAAAGKIVSAALQGKPVNRFFVHGTGPRFYLPGLLPRPESLVPPPLQAGPETVRIAA